jgi:hypothetical protein
VLDILDVFVFYVPLCNVFLDHFALVGREPVPHTVFRLENGHVELLGLNLALVLGDGIVEDCELHGLMCNQFSKFVKRMGAWGALTGQVKT